MKKLSKASEGYFLAKREMQDAIMRRVEVLEKKLAEMSNDHSWNNERNKLKAKIEALEETRSFVRNVMLWDTGLGK